MIEVLLGKATDEPENYTCVLPVHCLRTNQQIKNGEEKYSLVHIRCKSNGNYEKKQSSQFS